jgi:TRAP-type C4-dicarboxylate transport system permease small subunit
MSLNKRQVKENAMTWNHGIRQFHRWVSLVFTLTVIANFAAMAMNAGQAPMWIVYAPLPPLFLLLGTGLYLFALPYLGKRRKEQAR